MKHKIQFFYGTGGIRALIFADIVAVLYEREHKELAEELIKRSEQAFKRLDEDKKLRKYIVTATANVEELDKMIDEALKPEKKWWKR